MINFADCKRIDIPEGRVKQIVRKSDGVVLWKGGYTNWVMMSINADGSIYNGGLGYKNGYRVRSGGAEMAVGDTACTGFIPVKGGDVVRVSGMPWFTSTSSANALNAADSSFTNLGQFTMRQDAKYGIFASTYLNYTAASIVEESEGVWKWVVPPDESGIKYIRVTGYDREQGAPGARMIITINEEIT